MARDTTRRKDFSQNFLHDRRLIRQLVRQAGIAGDDLVIEIGPGDGALTAELLHHARQVLAIEVDDRLVSRLQSRFADQVGFTLFAGDFLAFPLPCTPYKVFANLPYRHTAAIVGKLTSGTAPPAEMYLVMQLEAAERFMGTPTGTMLSTQLAPWFDMSIAHRFRRTDFRPAPAIESVLTRIHLRTTPLLPWSQRQRFTTLVAATFSAWKPTVATAMADLLIPATNRKLASSMGDAVRVRPSDLPPVHWIELFRALSRVATNADWERIAAAVQRLEQQQATISRRSQTSSRSKRYPKR